MGYIPTPKSFLKRAYQFLTTDKHQTRVIHYHLVCKKCQFSSLAKEHVEQELGIFSFRIEAFRVVKSYAPHLFHCVADIVFTDST
mmetsp:Transcript_10867/g.16285  ORF Transcript_10867/g.16285 Transcript_10867/m.16285 type:complete len:85 (+) Transcript_10867:217-471(+)